MEKYAELLQSCEDANQLWNEGRNYYNGNYGVEKDYEKAFRLFEKAAGLGSDAAENMLGYMYQHGEGVDKDERAAFDWYVKSAEHGNAWGQTNAGWCLTNGVGTKRDYQRAIGYFENAMSQQSYPNSAPSILGEIYEKGLGVERDILKSITYYVIAGEKHNSFSLRRLAYYSEVRVIKDLLSVYDPVPLADIEQYAQEGMSIFQGILALCYIDGIGVDVDLQKARKYLNMKDFWPFSYGLKDFLKAQLFEKDAADSDIVFDAFSYAARNGNKDALEWLENHFATVRDDQEHLDDRIRLGYQLMSFGEILTHQDRKRAEEVLQKAIEIAKEETEKGNGDHTVRIKGGNLESYYSPKNIGSNSAYKIGYLYCDGRGAAGADPNDFNPPTSMDDVEKAIEYLSLSVYLFEDSYLATGHLERIYRYFGMKKELVELYIELLKPRYSDEHEDVRKALCRCAKKGEYDQAIKLYNDFKKLCSDFNHEMEWGTLDSTEETATKLRNFKKRLLTK